MKSYTNKWVIVIFFIMKIYSFKRWPATTIFLPSPKERFVAITTALLTATTNSPLFQYNQKLFCKEGEECQHFHLTGRRDIFPTKNGPNTAPSHPAKCKSSSGPPFYQDKMFYSPFCSFFNFLGLLQRKGPVLLRVANNSQPAVITSNFCVVTNELFLYCLVNN